MQWKLIVLVLAIICGASFFIAAKNSTETFDQDTKAVDEVADKKTSQYKAGAVAFDAYSAVHGSPPLSEALDHYRKIAEEGSLSKEDMIARIRSDTANVPNVDQPAAIKVTDAQVDAELNRLKAHAVSAEALSAPIVKPVGGTALASRLQDLSEQLAAVARDARAAGAHAQVETFYSF